MSGAVRRWVALGAALAAAVAQAGEVTDIRIMEHGVYTLSRARPAASAEPAATRGAKTEIVLLEATDRIRATLGTIFGLRYHVDGQPLGHRATITAVTRFPPPGLSDPDAETPRASDRREVDVAVGDVRFHGFRLSEPWELVPGEWTIELWRGDVMMAEKTFTLRSP